jgi:signal transduction histidine kinase
MSPSPASISAFPIVEILEALDGWQREPGPEQRVAITHALESVLHMAGVDGAILEVSAPPLAHLLVGAGDLTDRIGTPDLDERGRTPDGGARPGGTPDLSGLTVHELASSEGDRPLGRLVLDARGAEVARDAAARSIGLALDAAWSRAAVHARAEQLAALESATRAVAAELDIDRVLQLIVDRVRDLVGARYAALGIVDARGRIERFMTSGIDPETRAAIGHVPAGLGLLGLIIREGRTFRTDDISSHPAHVGFPPNHPPMTSFLGVPVMVKGRSVGDLYLTDKPTGESFTASDERLVEMFAVHAGIAIDNARLHDEVQRLAVVDERERIGKDLHDGIIQSIYAVGLSLEDVPELVETEGDRDEAIARVDRAIDALNLVIADIRSYILRLSAAAGPEDDPVASLARLGEELGLHAVVDLDLDLEGGADAIRALEPDRRSDLLFIVREALSNVARHADASRLVLELDEIDGDLVLTIEDNGRGFDPAAVPGPDAAGRHQGLANMRARAIGMGGTFTIGRPEGSGTRIIVRVPAASQADIGEQAPPILGDADRD